MALRGHLWTLMPHVQRALRSAPPSLGEDWQGTVADETCGSIRLTGRLHVPAQARDAVVLVHGMGGSADSTYLRLAAAAAGRSGLASLRLSVRGADCLGEDYHHAGLVEDLLAALSSPELAPFERLFLLGFSLGGHVALRLAATVDVPRLAAVAAVCPPLDLDRTCAVIDERWSAGAYRAYLLASLKQIYAAVAARRAVPTPVERVASVRLIREWDGLVVAPRFGFADASDYYRRMSVGPLIPQLRVPTLIVSAMHDPMVPFEAVAPWVAAAPPLLTMRWVEEGGHLGFPASVDLGLGLAGGGRSLESQVFTWLRRR